MTEAPRERIVGLDVLRTSAILLVMVHHFRHISGTPEWVRFFGLRSFIGVDVFFVLSGYLIGGQLLRRRPSLLSFYARRWLRTVPVYLVVLMLLVAMERVPLRQVPLFALFAQNYLAPSTWLVTWSLCIEEHFYLVLPFCMFAPRTAALTAIAVSVIGRALTYDAAMPYDQFIDSFYVRTHLRLDGLALGVLVATQPWKFSPRISALVGFTLVVVCAFLPALTGSTSAPEERLRWFMAVPEFFIVGIGVALMLPWASKLTSVWKPFDFVVVMIAEHAFTLYLTHELSWGGWAQRFALSFVFAVVLRALVEKPFLALRPQKS